MNYTYISLILAAIIGIIGIFFDVTNYTIKFVLAGLLLLSLIFSFGITIKSDRETSKAKENLNLLIRSTELPQDIIKEISTEIDNVVISKGWEIAQETHSTSYHIYKLNSSDKEPGLIVLTNQNFNDYWILDEDKKKSHLENKLFTAYYKDKSAEEFDKHISNVISASALLLLYDDDLEFRKEPDAGVKISILEDGKKYFEYYDFRDDKLYGALKYKQEDLDELWEISAPLMDYILYRSFELSLKNQGKL